MELENRQRLEKNKITVVLGTIILIYITAIALLGLLDSTASMMRVVPRAIICVIMLVVFLVGYFRYKGTQTFIYICFAAMLIAYAATILTNRNVYMYAIAYPIVGITVLYLDRRLAQVIIAITAVLNIVAGIKNYITYPDTQGESFMQMIYMIVYCIAVYIVVNQLDRHTREKTDEAIKNMESAAGLAHEIIANSETLVTNLDEAREKAQLLTESMQTTNSSMCEIAESVKYTAEAIETQTLKTNNIQVNIENAEEQTGQMKDSAVEAQGAVREGVDLIMTLRDKSVQTSEITKQTRKNTEELDNSIREVESIIATILGISEQTNLLSLNASIEAARAGEAGKGFAVVADEIRNLSDETKTSTEKITEIIDKLTVNVNETSANMEKSAKFVEEQAGMIDDTKEKFEAVIEKTDFLYQTVEGITDAIGEILDANTQINDSITNLSATSEQVAASSENGTSVSEESMRALGEMNDILNRIFDISEQMKKLVS